MQGESILITCEVVGPEILPLLGSEGETRFGDAEFRLNRCTVLTAR